jgi:hypothetical protein
MLQEEIDIQFFEACEHRDTMATFHDMDPRVLERFLVSRKYTRNIQNDEVVYVRYSERNPSVCVKVYTSISNNGDYTRRRGADAIRVCVVYDDGQKSFGIGKFPKVYRTTSDDSILERVNDRLRRAAIRTNQWLAAQV